jgi:hypothetical protein
MENMHSSSEAEIGTNREIRFIKPGVAGSFTFNSLSTSSKCQMDSYVNGSSCGQLPAGGGEHGSRLHPTGNAIIGTITPGSLRRTIGILRHY